MVYKKYVYKKGKKFGPYYYESYRVGNKVKKRYLGSNLAAEDSKTESSHKLAYFFVALGIVALVFLAFYFINFNTGRVVLQLDDSYKLGEKVSGNFNLILKKGELIPSSSIVKIKLNNQEKTISLENLILNEKISGNFYAENLNLQGQGEGFGVVGTKTEYPEVDFTLVISKDKKEEQPVETPVEVPGQISQETPVETPTETTQETTTETTPVTETTNTQTESPVQEQSQDSSSQIEIVTTETTSQETPTVETPTESPPVPVVESPAPAEPSPITAQVIKENPNKIEVSGKTSKNQVFTYALEEDELVEIKQNSVSINGKKVDDNLISLSQSGNQVTISTSYSEEEQGFGREYLGDEVLILNISLWPFNLTAEVGTLEVSFGYSGEKIVDVSKKIKVEEQVQENETLGANLANVTIPDINITAFTLEEINITNITISNETIENVTIGNVSIETVQYQARIGQEVRWKKTIIKPHEENITIELPKETRNISVKKIDEIEKASDITHEVRVSGITGNAIQDNNWLKNLFRLTGRVIEETNITSEAVQVEISSNSSQVEIEYYTPAPEAFEFNITNGKRILVSAPELNYTNVLAYTEIPEEWKIKSSSSLSLSWFEDDNSSLKQQWNFEAFDYDNNSLIDYIEWNVPHLSNQSFELNNLSSSSVSSNVKCEAGGKYCHSSINDPSLVFYMPFDVMNLSLSTEDWSILNNNGSFFADAKLNTAGKYGGSAQFDGTGDYIDIADTVPLQIVNSNLTVSLWASTTNWAQQGVLLRKYSASGYQIYVFVSTIRASFRAQDFSCSVLNTTSGSWNHFVETWNGTGVTIYSNGAYCSSVYYTQPLITDTAPLRLGAVPGYGYDFNGQVDEVMIFNRSLSATEISQIYNTQFSRFVSSGNLTLNQTITSGHNDVEITTYNNNPSSTNLSLSVCHSTGCTSSQNMTNGTKKSFAISDQTSLLYMNFSFLTDGYNFFSPILMTNVSINIFGEKAPKFSFDYPTPASGVNYSPAHNINLSIIESSLTDFNFNWNGTNYTFYNSSLLMLYNFNNLSSFGENETYAVDIAGGRNATGYNGAKYNTTGKYGGAFQFDGINDYIMCNTTGLPRGSDNRTVVAWVKTNNLVRASDWNGIFGYGNAATSQSFWIGQEATSNVLYAGIYGEDKRSGFVFTTDTWYHIAVTLTTKKVDFYINGVYNSTFTFTNTPNTGNSFCYLSEGYPGAGSYWNGTIDEFMLFNRSLSAQEVSQLYLSNLAKVNSTLWLFKTSPNLTFGQNNTYQAFAKNVLGIENSTEMRELNLTVPLKVTIISPANQTYSTSNILFNLTLNYPGDNCKFSLNNWANNVSMTGLTATNFNFTNSSIVDGSYRARFWCNSSIGLVNDTTSIDFSIYTSAPLVNFTSPTPANGTTQTSRNILINVSLLDPSLNSFIFNWNGTNYSIYDTSLIAMYNLDNISILGENDSYSLDLTKYGNNCTAVNQAHYNLTGKYRGSFDFDGAADYLNCGSSQTLNTSNQFSVSLWIYPRGTGSSIGWDIIGKEVSAAAPYSSWNLELYSGGVLSFATGATDNSNDLLKAPAISSNSWTHIAASYNGSVKNFYINGNLVNTTAYTKTIKYTAAGLFSIGAFSIDTQPNNCFNGLIDEPRVWNRTLSSAEISQIYYSNLNKINSSQWGFYSNETNLTDGTYYYQASAVGLVAENSTETRFFTIDNTMPYVAFLSPINTTYNYSVINLNITNSSDSSSVWYMNSTGNFSYNQPIYFNLTNGAYTWYAYANDSLNNVNETFVSFYVNYTAPDTTSPYFTTIPANVSILYGQGFQSTFVGNDAINFDSFKLGNWSNYFVINKSGYLENITFNLGVGIYIINITINDSSGNTNVTWFQVQINKSDPSGGLNITGSNKVYPQVTNIDKSENNTGDIDCVYSIDKANGVFGVDASPVTFNYSTTGCANYTSGSITKAITITQNTTYLFELTSSNGTSLTYGNYTTVEGTACPNELTCNLTLNTTGRIANPSTLQLGAGNYNFTYNTTGNTNYSSNGNSIIVSVSQLTQNPTTLLNSLTSNLTLTYPTQINASFYNNNTEMIVSIGNAIVSPHLNYTYGSGHYIVNFTAVASENYSTFFNFMNFTINKASSVASLNINETAPIVYPRYVNITCNSQLFKNEINMTNEIGASILLGNGTYNYACIKFSNQNYTYDDDNSSLQVLKGTPSLTMLINGSASNQTANQSVQTNVSAYVDNSEQTIVLLNNSADMTSSNHLFNTLVNGSYNFTAYVLTSENYTYSTLTRWSHIINLTYDNLNPEIVLVAPSNGISAVTSAYNFTFNVSDESDINNCSLIIDNSIVSTLESISKTYTNGIYYSGLAVSSHTWSVNCTDIYGNIGNSSTKSLIVTSVPVTPTTTTSSGGGGGGGASVLFNLRANPGFINLDSIINQRLNGTIEITNLGTSTVYLDIGAIKLEGILEIDKTLILGSGETKTLEYFVNSPKDAGLYTGKIEFAYGGDSLQIPVTLNVKTEISLFDISVNLPPEYKKITKGGNLKAQINLLQAGLQEKADVTLVYMIKDFDSNTYLKESETIMVYKEKSYEKEFQISTFESGNYVIGAEVIYSGGVATASSNFDVVEKKPFSFWILIVVIAAFIIIIIVAVRYKKIVADRIKNSKKKR